MDFAQQERGGVITFLATTKWRATIFHARSCWGGGSQVFQLIFCDVTLSVHPHRAS